MAMAICFKCGSAKSGALVACRSCNAAPRTNSEYAISLALSDHLSSKEQLVQYSSELRSAKKLSVPREALAQALEALKDPQLLAMLGAQPAAPASAPAARAADEPSSADACRHRCCSRSRNRSPGGPQTDQPACVSQRPVHVSGRSRSSAQLARLGLKTPRCSRSFHPRATTFRRRAGSDWHAPVP